jgi:hypothetical protein
VCGAEPVPEEDSRATAALQNGSYYLQLSSFTCHLTEFFLLLILSFDLFLPLLDNGTLYKEHSFAPSLQNVLVPGLVFLADTSCPRLGSCGCTCHPDNTFIVISSRYKATFPAFPVDRYFYQLDNVFIPPFPKIVVFP